MDACRWPEQDIINKWAKEVGLEINHEDLLRLKRKVTEPRLEVQEQMNRLVAIEYTCSCILCHSTSGLAMVAHRDDQLQMVGWIFVCPSCHSKLKDKRLDWKISEQE